MPPVPPTWVRAVDLLCLGLVLVALIVAMSGGFRIRIAGLPFALTSPYRLLFWAVAVGLVRHFTAPAVPIYRDLPRRLAAWRQRPAVRAAFPVFVATRPAILLVGYLAVLMIGPVSGSPPTRESDSEIANLQARWDAGWYLAIVLKGYQFEPNKPDEQQSIAFFPAYPWIVRPVGLFLGNRPTSNLAAGTLVSFGAFFGALIYLYALARDTLGDEDARYALWLLASYPFAVFFGAMYTESLFLFGAVGAWYHFRKGDYAKAALLGFIVGLTRPNGCLLSVPLAILAVGPWLPASLAGGKPSLAGPPSLEKRREAVVKGIATAAMPGIGMLAYSAFIWYLTGDPLGWLKAHAAWGRTYQGLTAVVIDRYGWISNAGLSGYVATLPYDFVNGLGAIFVLAAIWPVARRLGLAFAVFMLINLLPPLAAGGLISVGRLSSTMFPAFIWLGGAVPKAQRVGWIAVFSALQALVAALFYTWRPLY